MAKRGPKAKYESYRGDTVQDIVNGELVGLSKEAKSGYYYYMYTDKYGQRKKQRVGKNIANAFRSFRRFVDKQKRETPTINLGSNENIRLVPRQLSEAEDRLLGSYNTFAVNEIALKEDALFDLLDNLLDDPILVQKFVKHTQRFGLLSCDDVMIKDFTLKQALEYYKNDTESEDYTYQRQIELQWEEFCRIINPIKTINHIDFDRIEKYKNELDKVRNNPDYRPAWLGEKQKKDILGRKLPISWRDRRIDNVKAVINNLRDRTTDEKHIARIIKDLKKMRSKRKKGQKGYPSKNVGDKRLFTPKEFQAILQTCQSKPSNKYQEKRFDRFYTMVLLAMNFGFTLVDFSQLLQDDIEWETNRIIMRRGKTLVIRVGRMWEETQSALKKFMEKYPNHTEYIFLSKDGNPYDSRASRKQYIKLLKDVKKVTKLEINVDFKQFRKSSYSAAINNNVPLDIVKVLHGHAQGIEEHYVLFREDYTDLAVNAIHDYYFNQSPK
jgi:integrase